MTVVPNINWLLLMSVTGLPTLTDPNSKEPEAVKLKIVSNHLAMEYLKTSATERLKVLDTFRTPLNALLDQLNDLSEALDQETLAVKKSIDEACQKVESV